MFLFKAELKALNLKLSICSKKLSTALTFRGKMPKGKQLKIRLYSVPVT